MGEVISGSYPAPATTGSKGKEKPVEVGVVDE
jgi:hypothetical protein